MRFASAEELDPLSFRYFADAAMIYYDWRRVDQAVLQAQKSLSLQPDYFIAHSYLGMIYAQTGSYSEAIRRSAEGGATERRPVARGVLGYAYATAGNKSQAQKIAAALQGNFDEHFVCPFEIGTIYVGSVRKTYPSAG